jgi:hypothetical protein
MRVGARTFREAGSVRAISFLEISVVACQGSKKRVKKIRFCGERYNNILNKNVTLTLEPFILLKPYGIDDDR